MIYYRGRWLIEPEIKALLTKLEDLNKELRSEADRVLREIAELRAKVESANRQIAEYKRLLKAVAKIAKNLPCDDGNCGECVHNDNGYVCSEYECFEWRYADEALALIGEDGEQNENG